MKLELILRYLLIHLILNVHIRDENRIQGSYLSNVCIIQDVIHFAHHSYSEDKWWFLSTVSLSRILFLKRHRRNLHYLRRTGVRTRNKSRWTDNEYLTRPIWMLSESALSLPRRCEIMPRLNMRNYSELSLSLPQDFLSLYAPCGLNALQPRKGN